jgi:uncharacterized protein (TIGR00369 family)
MTAAEMNRFLVEHFPLLKDGLILVEDIDAESSRTRMESTSLEHMRPGDVVNGPAMMTLADIAAYIEVQARIGPVVNCFTQSLNINFLRQAEPGAIVAHTRMVRLGGRAAVVAVEIFSRGGRQDAVAFATVTYALPDRRGS